MPPHCEDAEFICLQDTTRCQTGCHVCIHDTTGCQPVGQQVVSCIQTFNRLSNRFDNRLFNCNPVVQPV